MNSDKLTQEIDEIVTRIDWDSLTYKEKIAFSNMMLAIEVSSREKEKRRSITSSFTSFTMFVMLTNMILMFLGVDSDVLLVVVLGMLMLALSYSQLLEKALSHLNFKALDSAKKMIENFEKKYPKS